MLEVKHTSGKRSDCDVHLQDFMDIDFCLIPTPTILQPFMSRTSYYSGWHKNLVWAQFQTFQKRHDLFRQTLAGHNSTADGARELFKPCNDSWHHVVQNNKNYFKFGWGVFGQGDLDGGMFFG